MPATGTPKGSKPKQSLVVKLRLPPFKLTAFPHDAPSSKSSNTKATPSDSTSTPPVSKPASPPEVKVEEQSESKAATPAMADTLKVPADGPKKKGPKPGTKRPGSALLDGQPKQRGKPGPKKRKLDGPLGDEANRPWTTPATGAAHKLGPKANQGAINAGLRALDRTGTQTRKWNKAAFSVKSFTGVVWGLPSWATVPRKSEGDSGSPTSNGENQPPAADQKSSSQAGSDVNSTSRADNTLVSSPATPMVTA